MRRHTVFTAILLICCACNAVAQPLPTASSPEEVGLSSAQLRYADQAIERAIAARQMPGAVLAVVKDGKMAYLKAYGHKAVYPQLVSMDTETIFDLASVTKPMATATATMILIERGLLRLQDRVNLLIPNFQGWITPDGKKKDIRLVDLLTHTSGLPPYAPVETLQKQYGSPNPDALINYIATCPRDFEPQTGMQYSCLNFIVLQRIIETVSEQSLDDFTKEHIFDPLGMTHTGFNPKSDMLPLIGPTERQKNGDLLCGTVHDPLARVMNGGVSGNAGLFSNARDVALFVAALQNGGEWNGKRILSPLSVTTMRTVPRHVAQFGRSLGWDVFSSYASNTGDLLSSETYGHTGYTGTSVIIDPINNISIILLTNKAHPDDKGDVIRLRSLVANAVAAAIRHRKDGPNRQNTAPPSSPAQPSWSYEAHRAKRLALFAQEEPISSTDIVMLGNSLTEGGKWAQWLQNNRLRNRGIAGDNTNGVLSRLESIVNGKPKKLFLLIGINDIANDTPTDSVVSNIEAILNEIIRRSPGTTIYLQSLLPVNQSFGRYKRLTGKTSVIIQVNTRIEQLAKRKKVRFINLYPLFVAPDSDTLRKTLTNDGLHLNEEGYAIWLKVLRRFL